MTLLEKFTYEGYRYRERYKHIEKFTNDKFHFIFEFDSVKTKGEKTFSFLYEKTKLDFKIEYAFDKNKLDDATIYFDEHPIILLGNRHILPEYQQRYSPSYAFDSNKVDIVICDGFGFDVDGTIKENELIFVFKIFKIIKGEKVNPVNGKPLLNLHGSPVAWQSKFLIEGKEFILGESILRGVFWTKNRDTNKPQLTAAFRKEHPRESSAYFIQVEKQHDYFIFDSKGKYAVAEKTTYHNCEE